MGFDLIGVGAAPGDGTGDPLRTAAQKFNAVVTALNAAGWGSSGGPRPVVDYATAAALATNTYSAGVITASANGALSVDGASPAVGKRILVKDEASQLKNGIYVVTAAGSAGAAFVLTRASDMDTWAEVPGSNVWVEEGSTNADKAYVCTADAGGTLGTTAIVWSQFGGSGAFQQKSAVLDVYAALNSPAANVQSILNAADYAAIKTLLSLVAGTDFYSKAATDAGFQPLDSDLTAIAALATTSFGRALLTGADLGGIITLLGGARETCKGLRTWNVLAASAVAVTITGDTTKHSLATITVPANEMGPNGGVRVTAHFENNNNANSKTAAIYWNGASGTVLTSAGLTTNVNYRVQTMIFNRNATNSQVANNGETQGGWGGSSVASPTAAVDTTAAVDIVITGQLANSGDTLTLNSYLVEIFHGA